MRRLLLILLLAAPLLAQPALSPSQIKELVTRTAENDIQNDLKSVNYTYTVRTEQRHLNGDGKVEKTESRKREYIVLYGDTVGRLIERDGKPLSPEDAAKEEARIQKLMDQRRNESDDERNQRREKKQKDLEEDRKFVREVADAYDFTFVGAEPVNGREAWIIDAVPRPGFQPQSKDAKYLPKFRFRAWIDKQESQLARLHAEVIDTVSWGLFLARLHKGSTLDLEQVRLNDEIWLPTHESARLDARLALFKTLRMDVDSLFQDYKRFRAETRITPVPDPPQ